MIFISKTLVRSRHDFISKLCILDLFPFSRSMSTCSIVDPNEPSFQVSYLVNSCGLSPESALKASKSARIKFKTPEKPDSVIAFFKKNGFSQTQISKLIRGKPQLITSNPEKTLLPKLKFFYSKGISVPDVAKIMSMEPNVLTRSLENQLIPTFNFFTEFLQSEDNTISTIIRCPFVLVCDLQRCVLPIIDIFRNYGVPESNIMICLEYKPRGLVPNFEKFRELTEEVKKMGFDPSRVSFVQAIIALRSMNKLAWKRKVELYERWGWSHEEFLQAFRKYPLCMAFSMETITAKMDFFVNKMGLDPSVVALRPQYITFSLEKRIIPRWSVLVELLSKGLIKKQYSVGGLLESTDKIFLRQFVNRYKDEATHLLKIYHEKLSDAKEREVIDP